MNNQEKRTEIAREIIVGCKIGRIVETGTYLGTTTAFLAGFGVPVTTAERNPDLAREAAERLRPWSNIEVRGEDSVRVLQALVREPIDREVPTFFIWTLTGRVISRSARKPSLRLPTFPEP